MMFWATVMSFSKLVLLIIIIITIIIIIIKHNNLSLNPIWTLQKG